jgi:hypothetical protein
VVCSVRGDARLVCGSASTQICLKNAADSQVSAMSLVANRGIAGQLRC